MNADGFFYSLDGFFCSERANKSSVDDKFWSIGVIPSPVKGIFYSIGANHPSRGVIRSSPEGNVYRVNAGVCVDSPIPRFNRANKTVGGAKKTIGRAKKSSAELKKTIARPKTIAQAPKKTVAGARQIMEGAKTSSIGPKNHPAPPNGSSYRRIIRGTIPNRSTRIFVHIEEFVRHHCPGGTARG